MKLDVYEKSLKMARSSKQLNVILKNYLNSLGIKTFAFTYYSYYPNSVNKLTYDFCTENYEPWHKHYISEHYEEVDTTFDRLNITSLPTFWDLQEQLRSAKTKREKQMRLDSIHFGIEKGLSIPIYGPQEEFAVLVIIQMHNDKSLKNWPSLKYELFVAAYYYYSYLRRILFKEQPILKKHQLTKREIQCLTLIAKQYSLPEIANILHITERTINFHIQRLNKKLGTSNKYQSVIKALNAGIIRL